MRKSFFASALTAGLIAGTLDITAACIHAYIKSGTTPAQVLRYVASGAFGKDATAGGASMAAWGLLFHFLIAISFTFFFFLLAMQFPSILKRPVLTAFVYGIFVWSVMRFIVLPYFSEISPRPIVGKEAILNSIIAAGILVICIGLPNAFLAKSAMRRVK